MCHTFNTPPCYYRCHTVAIIVRRSLSVLIIIIFVVVVVTTENPDIEQRKCSLGMIVNKLPRVHRDVLYYLFAFLNELSTHKEKTKMGIPNLGM